MRQAAVAVMMAWVAFLAASAQGAEEQVEKALAKIETSIKRSPGNPMLYYQKSQCQMKLGQCDEGFETAKCAMQWFVKKNQSLAWMLLESVEVEDVRVDIHFNMGPRERTPPDVGIMRPLSFRVWKKDKTELLEIIDFEIGTSGGKPSTAVLGQTTAAGHGSFVMLPTESKYTAIREKALELIEKRHAPK